MNILCHHSFPGLCSNERRPRDLQQGGRWSWSQSTVPADATTDRPVTSSLGPHLGIREDLVLCALCHRGTYVQQVSRIVFIIVGNSCNGSVYKEARQGLS